MHSENLKLN